MSKPSPELVKLREFLSDGGWHHGQRVVREVEDAVPPNLAQDVGRALLKNPDQKSTEQQIASGKRHRATTVISGALERGNIECDVEKLTRGHWAGRAQWRLRDPMVGYRSVSEVADELGITESVIRSWIGAGFVPHSTSPGGLIRFAPTEIEICRRVREIWPGPGKMRWPTDPRTLWQEQGMVALVCPHCNEKISVTVGKA